MGDNELLLAISDLLDQKLNFELQPIKDDLQLVKNDTKELKKRVTSLEMTLENETNKNIMRVAEGHLDLSRKLDAALNSDAEKEMLAIKVNILENEIRKIKEQLASA